MTRWPLVTFPIGCLTGGVAAAQTDPRLADAAMNRDATLVRSLVTQKIDVNAAGRDGTPPLHWAVRA